MKASFLFLIITICLFVQLGFTQSTLTLLPRIEEDSMIVHIKNNVSCPMFVVLSPKEKDSWKGKYLPKFVIPAKDTLKNIFSYPILKPEDSIRTRAVDLFNFKITYGNPGGAKPDENFQYTLPFQKGLTYKIIQGFNGKFSHNYDRSRHAIDFNMNIGDTICAARRGIVVTAKEDSNKGGKTRKYQSFSNKIVIYHEDGTFAHYAHLVQNGVLVELGDTVEKGQAIGISGNTGFSSGPHLHFVVRIPTEEGEKSIPIQFENVKSKKLRRSGRMVTRKK